MLASDIKLCYNKLILSQQGSYETHNVDIYKFSNKICYLKKQKFTNKYTHFVKLSYYKMNSMVESVTLKNKIKSCTNFIIIIFLFSLHRVLQP